MKSILDFFEKLFKAYNWEKGKKNIFYYKKSEKIIFCIQIQQYSFGIDNNNPYTFNFSIICHEIYEELLSKKMIKILPEYGIIDLRPYEFFKSIKLKYKEFWLIEEFDRDKNDLENIFKAHVFPFFNGINTLKDVYCYIIENKINLLGLQQEQFKLLNKKVG